MPKEKLLFNKLEIKYKINIIGILKSKGFKINRYYAKTTKSIYIKLDYGVVRGNKNK